MARRNYKAFLFYLDDVLCLLRYKTIFIRSSNMRYTQRATLQMLIFNRPATDTGNENSDEDVKATHPSCEPNDPTVEEPKIEQQLLIARAEIRDLTFQVEALKLC